MRADSTSTATSQPHWRAGSETGWTPSAWESFGTYQAYLEIHPKEFALLFNIIPINVTGFFRDPAAWEAVRTAALRQIVGGKGPDEPIRAWSAGCALSDGGFLLLGRAETLMAHGQCFVPVDLKRRLSRKSTRGAHLS